MDDEKPANLVVECPHCKQPVLIEKLNCCIFRHGVSKKMENKLIPTHLKICVIFT